MTSKFKKGDKVKLILPEGVYPNGLIGVVKLDFKYFKKVHIYFQIFDLSKFATVETWFYVTPLQDPASFKLDHWTEDRRYIWGNVKLEKVE